MHPERNDSASEDRPRRDSGSAPLPASVAKHASKIRTPLSVTIFRYAREEQEAPLDSGLDTLTSTYCYDPDDESLANVGAGAVTRFVYAAPEEHQSKPRPDETPSA